MTSLGTCSKTHEFAKHIIHRLSRGVTFRSQWLQFCYFFSCPAGKNLSAIVAVLEEVSDWEDLGYKLDVKERRLQGIEEGCGSGKGRATCCRRDLVKAYCNAMGLVPVETVVGNIAAALDEMDLAK